MRFSSPSLVVLLLLSMPSLSASEERSAPDNLRLVVLAGQSNMSGRGDIHELPVGFPQHGNRIWNYTNEGKWKPAAEPLDDETKQIDVVSADSQPGVGPGLAFADALAAEHPDWSIGLIPCAKGGSSIKEWAPSPLRTTLYGSCIARTIEAMSQGTVIALLWYQGESDVDRPESVQQWPVHVEAMLSAFRFDLKTPGMPVIAVSLGQISIVRRSDLRFHFWDEMQLLQKQLSLPGVVFVDASVVELDEKDGLHLSTSGQMQLGQLMAEAFKKSSVK